MRIPTILAVALAAVLAGSLLLIGPLAGSNSIFHTKHSEVPKAEAAPLPLNIMERFTSKLMAGDARSGNNLKVDEEFVDPENHCEFCTRVEYTPGAQGLAGFAYRSDESGGIDLTGAKKVRFWVMGEDGGEKIKFKVAGKALERLQDRLGSRLTDRLPPTSGIFQSERFALTTQDVTLGSDWRKLEVDLTGVDLRGVTSPFGFEIAEGNGVQVFYLKGVVYDTEPAQNALLTVEEEITEPLTAEINANSTEGVAPATFEFEANVTGGSAESYDFSWDFDDGSGSEEQDAVHTFAEAGEYNVTLAVTDESQSASDSVLIQVAEPEVIGEPADNGAEDVPANTTGIEEEDQGAEENGNATGDAAEQQGEAPAETVQDIMPEVNAGMDLFALPGDTVVMGGEVTGIDSGAAEGLDLLWTQESGPEAEIDDEDSLNPAVTIPDDLGGDARLDLQLAATLGQAGDADDATIFAEHVEEVDEAQEETLDPSESVISEWNNDECGGDNNDIADCMSDGSDNTFAAALPDDASDINLFSFEEFEDNNNNIEIEHVTAVTTARADEPGYLLLAWADGEDAEDYDEAEAAVSVASGPFQEYEYVWEENPATESPWTVDSLNSFLAGYVYADGESDIEVSEFSLVVTYTIVEVQG